VVLADLIHRMLQRKPASRITLEGIGRHPWLQGAQAPAPNPCAPVSPPLPAEAQPAKKARSLEVITAGLGGMRMSQGSSGDDDASSDGAQPGCGLGASPLASLFVKAPSFRRDEAPAPTPSAASPRAGPKWPRWMALNQGGGK